MCCPVGVCALMCERHAIASGDGGGGGGQEGMRLCDVNKSVGAGMSSFLPCVCACGIFTPTFRDGWKMLHTAQGTHSQLQDGRRR